MVEVELLQLLEGPQRLGDRTWTPSNTYQQSSNYVGIMYFVHSKYIARAYARRSNDQGFKQIPKKTTRPISLRLADFRYGFLGVTQEYIQASYDAAA